MRKTISKMWNDDAGIVALEYLLVATVLGLALVVGLANLSASINAELTELGQAIMSLNQGYTVNSQSSCGGTYAGSTAVDSAAGTNTFHVGAAGTAGTGFVGANACQ